MKDSMNGRESINENEVAIYVYDTWRVPRHPDVFDTTVLRENIFQLAVSFLMAESSNIPPSLSEEAEFVVEEKQVNVVVGSILCLFNGANGWMLTQAALPMGLPKSTPVLTCMFCVYSYTTR